MTPDINPVDNPWTSVDPLGEALHFLHMKGVIYTRSEFTALVGGSPIQYVTRWRMNVALTWHKEEDASLEELAGRLGYQADAAFSRAFKRFIGVSPDCD